MEVGCVVSSEFCNFECQESYEAHSSLTIERTAHSLRSRYEDWKYRRVI